ncbi:BapA/Bap/LapF family large adhesin [Sphingomonas sp. OV641]|uniref:BapA/Bap/LapF family large adhesin n=1 Tax=Sphingomonas sp. OV641 TaxID=1881068 RepID=UPI000AFCF7AE|nr:BapA/Bap/LapF family large adhesin [Sphingomonas sp. OV641]
MASDGTSVLVNVGNFSDTFEFTVASGTTTDATFTVTAGGLVGVLNNPTAVLEVNTGAGWVRLGDASTGGLLDLLGAARGFTVTAEDLQAGDYRLTYGGGGTLGVGTEINLTAELADASLTEFELVSAAPVTGNIFAASEAGPADERGTGNAAVLQVLNEEGIYVAVPPGTQVLGEYGTLVINPDGSFTYTPSGAVESIGLVDSFQYQLIGPDGASQATLNIRLDSPDADIVWDQTDLGADGTTVVATDDTDQASVLLAPRVETTTVNNAIDYTSIAALGGSDTYRFNVAADTTADLTLNVTSNSLLNLLGQTNFTLQQYINNRWVALTGSSGGSLIELAGLTGGGIQAQAEDLGPGSYRVVVSTGGLGVLTDIDGVAIIERTYLNEFVPSDVVLATGNVVDGGPGADILGSDSTVLRIERQDGVFVAPGYGGVSITGDYGVLTIQANGDYVYRPFLNAASLGQTDRFTYELIHPNSDRVEAELAIDIVAPTSGGSLAAISTGDEAPAEATVATLHADVVALDGLVGADVSIDDGLHAQMGRHGNGAAELTAEPMTADATLLDLHGDTVVLAGLDDPQGAFDSEDLGSIGSYDDAVSLPAFEDVLEIEPQDDLPSDPSSPAGAATVDHPDQSAEAIEIEAAVLIDNPLHDPWTNAVSHV